ncbi:electron transport complex protein RnfD [Cohaesibacter sp. ES.047]|uniref:RnfABCDGE type electron transport complex subunit D n=1 Tax=Cohaesibacter sp. ES.047 TaxID=1798205 RepID=UPI000BB75795|nr:RnfABCDGE type electron transport complex subunit D [Cohaesibacter sp. ES.047]SNY92903.1 electron transport complex protein RnfD [Cohaesibacter sp. ES.047]
MSAIDILSGPYTHSGASVSRTMGLVMVALLPSTLFGFYQFGWPAVFLFVVTVLVALLCEALCLRLAGKPVKTFVMDGSGLLTGWLLAMTLPPWAPWWVGAIGAIIAISLAKHAFGGLGQNIFNPAMVARTILLISFPVQMTQFINPVPLGSAGAPNLIEGLYVTLIGHTQLDAFTGASMLGSIKTQLSQGEMLPTILSQSFDLRDMAVGMTAGSMGETSALLALLGGLFLIATRVITWHTSVAMTVAMVALSGLFHAIDPNRYADPMVHLVSGTFVFAVFFIATDYVTAPGTALGKLVFGAGVGTLTFIIRTWAAYPEGVAFAILLMNATVPLIDTYIKTRVYGRTRKGTPIEYDDKDVERPV